jgi:serine/threonine-protein phosphatase PPG1
VVSPRGAGYIFGEEVLQKFLHHNGFNHLTRAHQLCTEGYQLLFKDALSTVWSAPNYVYRMGNMASIMEIDEFANRSFNIFAESPENIARGIVAAAADSKIIKNETEKYFM